MIIGEEIISKLTPEQKKAVENAKSPEDIIAIAKEQGYELSDEQIDAIAGGDGWGCSSWHTCNTLSCPIY